MTPKLLVSLSVLCCLSVEAAVRLSGTAEKIVNKRVFMDGSVTFESVTNSFSFDVTRNDKDWKIDIRFEDAVGARASYARVDGVVYELDYLQTEEPLVFVAETNKFGDPIKRIVAKSRVYLGEIPYEEGFDLLPIWLAYCSDQYIKTNLGEKLKPMWSTGWDIYIDPDFGYRFNLSRFSESPGLPERLELVSDGRMETIFEDGGFHKIHKYPKPYHNGYTNGVFKAEDLQELGGNAFPQRFSMVRYSPVEVY